MTKGKLTKQPGTSDTTIDSVVEASVRNEIQQMGISNHIAELRVTDAYTFEVASGMLAYIRECRKRAVEVFAEKIRTPILEPLRKSLDGLYKLERELTKKPFDDAEKTVKAKMAAFNQKRIDSGEELVKADGSKSGVKRTPVITDWPKFLAAILAGDVPEGVVQINEEVMEAYWKVDAGLVSAWPGVSIEEVAKVGGR